MTIISSLFSVFTSSFNLALGCTFMVYLIGALFIAGLLVSILKYFFYGGY
nr:MAG TPA: hypothetical protein [Inoviridae sp.]